MNFSTVKRNIIFVFLGSFVCVFAYILIIIGLQIKEESKQTEARSLTSEESKEGDALKEKEKSLTEFPLKIDQIKDLTGAEGSLWIDHENSDLCVITLGKDYGVKKGMLFNIFYEDDIVGQVKIENVDEVFSLGRLLSFKRDLPIKGYYKVKVSA